jgi:ribosome-binding protein aMBF1 (putative translation factor)
VVLPTSEYERLLLGKMARLSERLLDSSKASDWSDADEVLAQIASSRIAEFRRLRGLSQRELGKQLGMPQSQLSRIERNPDSTTLRVLKRIAGALGVRVADLV